MYFVTICTAERRTVFGDVVWGRMRSSAVGQIANREWVEAVSRRPEVVGDVFVVMPNHVHLLFGIVDVGSRTDADMTSHAPTAGSDAEVGGEKRRAFGKPQAKSVSMIVGAHKAAVTRSARRLGMWPDGPLWQTRFHDRVVRSDLEAGHIRRYIENNPAQWARDRFNADASLRP